jgi:hypothetical protein
MRNERDKKSNVPAIWQYLKQFAAPYRVHPNPLVIVFLSSLLPMSCMMIPIWTNEAKEEDVHKTNSNVQLKPYILNKYFNCNKFHYKD